MRCAMARGRGKARRLWPEGVRLLQAFVCYSATPERGSHHMTWDGSPARVRPVNRQLWKKFVHIAQPYFYPLWRGGGGVTRLLMVLLLVWVFASLFFLLAAISLAGHYR